MDETAMPVTILTFAGQSNVNASQIDHRLVEPLDEGGGAFEFVKVGQGGTSIFATSRLDWNPASEGELFDRTVDETLAAIANATDQGQTAEVTLFYAQGESDKQSSSADFGRELRALIEAFRVDTGQPDAKVVLLLLPYECGPRDAMLELAAQMAGVFTVETRDLDRYDGVHFTDAGSQTIAERFSAVVDLSSPAIDGYENLLDEGYYIDQANKGIFVGPEQLSTEFIRDDLRNYQIRTSTGDDFIKTGAGLDGVVSGNGADQIDTGANNDRIMAGRGDDRLFGRDGNDELIAEYGDDRVFGGNGNDFLHLGDQRDLGLGDAGDDVLIGGLGADILWGGAGADMFRYDSVEESRPGQANADLIRDFEQGIDKVDLAALGPLAFNETGHFSGGSAQLACAITSDRTILRVDLSGDRVSDFIIQFSGEIAFTASDFILG